MDVGFEKQLRNRIDAHAAFLASGGILEQGVKVTKAELDERERKAQAAEERVKNPNKFKKDPRAEQKYIPGVGFYTPLTQQEIKGRTPEEISEAQKKKGGFDFLPPEIREQEAEAKAKEALPEEPVGPVNKPKKVDLVQYYESLLGKGPRSGEVDPSKVDLNNPVVIRRLRSNEIAIARVAGAERGLGGSRVKEYRYGGDPASVDLPYPDMEQVRGGKRVLSNIEREYYAYQGASEAANLKFGPLSYFQKYYNEILNRTDPIYKRSQSAEKRKAENEAINAARESGRTEEREVNVFDPTTGRMKKETRTMPVESRGEIKRRLRQEGMTDAEKEADKPPSVRRREAIADAKKEVEAQASDMLLELTRARLLATHYSTLIRFPDPVNEKFLFDVDKRLREQAVGALTTHKERIIGFSSDIGAKLSSQKVMNNNEFSELVKTTREAAQSQFADQLSTESLVQGLLSENDSTKELLEMVNIAEILAGYTRPDLDKLRVSTHRKDIQKHSGGMIPGRAETPLYAQGGEFVMQRSAVNRIGAGNLHYMNNGGNVPANGTMNVMGGESISDAAGKLENALINHAIPETISVQLGNLSVDIGGNVLPGMETMVKQAIAEALMDYENTKDTDNSPGSYGRSVAQERFGNTA